MADDLRELFERLDYCELETAKLDSQIGQFAGEHFHVTRRAAGNRGFDVYAGIGREVPTAIRSAARLVMHEPRSVLEALVCRLAERNGRTASSVQFPIVDGPEKLDNAMSMVSKLSEADKVKIRALKPYRGGNNLLFALHALDKAKHRGLAASTVHATQHLPGVMAVGSQVELQNISINGVHIPRLEINPEGKLTFEPGREVLMFRGVPPGLHVSVGFSLAYLEPEEIAHRNVVALAHDFVAEVRRVITLFA